MNQSKGTTSRRSLLRKGLAVGGAGAVGAGLLNAGLLTPGLALAREMQGSSPTQGDIDILKFLFAIETVETDLWQQYNELGGIIDNAPDEGDPVVTTGVKPGNPAYQAALRNLDADMNQYIHDNTDDEFTHAGFLKAFLESVGATPPNLEPFLILPSSQADGAVKNAQRLTNLMHLKVDTSWWTRYRSATGNPDSPFNNTFDQAIPTLFNNAPFPAIPRNNADTAGSTGDPNHVTTDHLQAIANTAAFHFGFIEQGGTSLYPTLAQGVTDLTVLRILLSIGPTETMHFQVWHDKAGNAVTPGGGTAPVPLTVIFDGKQLIFPDLTMSPGDEFTPNLIMPEPTVFLSRTFPIVSIIRPTQQGVNGTGGAVATVNSFTADGLFFNPKTGTNSPIVAFLTNLAVAADTARRGGV